MFDRIFLDTHKEVKYDQSRTEYKRWIGFYPKVDVENRVAFQTLQTLKIIKGRLNPNNKLVCANCLRKKFSLKVKYNQKII